MRAVARCLSMRCLSNTHALMRASAPAKPCWLQRLFHQHEDGTELVGTLSTAPTAAAAGGGDGQMAADPGASQPAPPPPPSQCIFLLHGGMGHRDYLYHKQLTRDILSAEWALAHGIAVFRFDYNNNGDSGGQRFFLAGFWDDIADIRAAMCTLGAPPFGLRTVALIGHSVGAQHVLQLAATSIAPSSAPGASTSPAGRPPLPPLLVCVQPRFRLQYWYEEWERQCASSADGCWAMKWRSRGKSKSHVITREDVAAYAAVDMDGGARLLNRPELGGGRVHMLTVHGIARDSGSSAAKVMGYGSDDEAGTSTLDGVVPAADCVEVANRVCSDRHTLRIVPGMDHYFKEPGAKDRLWQQAIGPWLAEKLPLVSPSSWPRRDTIRPSPPPTTSARL